MKSPLVIKIEGWISFLIPFLSGIGGAGILSDSPNGKIIALFCTALVAGLSGLKTFFSTTFSDSLPDVQPNEPAKPTPPAAASTTGT